MRYLKKVMLAFGTKECEQEADLLEEVLADEGMTCIKCKVNRKDQTLLTEGDEAERSAGTREETDGATERTDGVLWLTDDESYAQVLLEKKMPVLACISPENDSFFSGVKYVCDGVAELEPAFLESIYRRYKGLPWDICETPRCFIRETTVADVDDFYEIYKEPSITKYMENLFEDPEKERAYARDYIDKVYSFYGCGVWTICLKDSGQVIGRAGLSFREGFEEPELGFVIGVPWQRQGLAFEVCDTILRFGREVYEFEKVISLVEPENEASVRLCRKLDFCLQEEIWLEGIRYLLFTKKLA